MWNTLPPPASWVRSLGVDTRSFHLYRANLGTELQGGTWVLAAGALPMQRGKCSSCTEKGFRKSRTCVLCYLASLPWALGETSFLLFPLVLTLAVWVSGVWYLISLIDLLPCTEIEKKGGSVRNKKERSEEEGEEGRQHASWEGDWMVTVLQARGPEFRFPYPQKHYLIIPGSEGEKTLPHTPS